MSDKTFQYHDEEWQATCLDPGHGDPALGMGPGGALPPVRKHRTRFTRLSDGRTAEGRLSTNDPASLTDLELRIALSVALGEIRG